MGRREWLWVLGTLDPAASRGAFPGREGRRVKVMVGPSLPRGLSKTPAEANPGSSLHCPLQPQSCHPVPLPATQALQLQARGLTAGP